MGEEAPTPEELLRWGTAHHRSGRLGEAENAYQRVLAENPKNATALNLLGVLRKQQGQPDEAAALFRRAISAQPNVAKLYDNLGSALVEQKKLPEAAQAYRSAAITFLARGQLTDAVTSCQRAIEADPTAAASFVTLAGALRQQGQIDTAIMTVRHALSLDPALVYAHSNMLMMLYYHPDWDAPARFEEHRRWDALHAARLADPSRVHANDRNSTRRLRVGYVSPDLHRHAVSYFIEPILAFHDHGDIEVFCYADEFSSDDTTARLRRYADTWRNTADLGNGAMARLIREDRIDILVDLAGHSANNRLRVFARKPAPVQVTYIGYPGTTGMSAMDYRITDATADPPGQERFYTESLVRLAGGFCCYRPPEGRPDVEALPASRVGWVTFGSLHGPTKINARVLDTWAQVLAALPSSRLLLMRHTLRDGVSERMRSEFARRGVSPDRIDVEHGYTPAGYLDVYQKIDIALDVFPWSGHTTACESMWSGVPIVTLGAGGFAGRMVASVLTQLGLDELIARSPDHYVRLAVELAGDVERLTALRRDLRGRMQQSPLCDALPFTRGLERAYRSMWEKWCEQ